MKKIEVNQGRINRVREGFVTTFSDAEKKEQEKLNNHFSELVHHDMHHEARKAQ